MTNVHFRMDWSLICVKKKKVEGGEGFQKYKWRNHEYKRPKKEDGASGKKTEDETENQLHWKQEK